MPTEYDHALHGKLALNNFGGIWNVGLPLSPVCTYCRQRSWIQHDFCCFGPVNIGNKVDRTFDIRATKLNVSATKSIVSAKVDRVADLLQLRQQSTFNKVDCIEFNFVAGYKTDIAIRQRFYYAVALYKLPILTSSHVDRAAAAVSTSERDSAAVSWRSRCRTTRELAAATRQTSTRCAMIGCSVVSYSTTQLTTHCRCPFHGGPSRPAGRDARQRKPGQRTCDSDSPQIRCTGFRDQPNR